MAAQKSESRTRAPVIMHTDFAVKRVSDLVPYANNSRTHSPEQVSKIAGSIRAFGFTNPVLLDEDGTIVAGHGRVMAAQTLGMSEVPVVTLHGLTEVQRRQYVIADNRLALDAGWDEAMLALELKAIELEGASLEATGFETAEIERLMDGQALAAEDTGAGGAAEAEPSGQYTHKIILPVYTPKGEKPSPSELFDDSKTKELRSEIVAATLPEDVRAFLLSAAERHTVFHFRRVAEFYAHSGPDTQRLMERSALVIIDFDKAIENGFVKLSKTLGALAERTVADAANGAEDDTE